MLSGIPFPTGSVAQRTIFYQTSQTGVVAWQPYNIPPNATMLYMFLLGGGGGGGLGFTGAAGSADGGGGGGSGGQTVVRIPAAFLPSTIYVSIGNAGDPSAAGGISRISLYPDATAANFTIAIANGGGAGGNGTGTARATQDMGSG